MWRGLVCSYQVATIPHLSVVRIEAPKGDCRHPPWARPPWALHPWARPLPTTWRNLENISHRDDFLYTGSNARCPSAKTSGGKCRPTRHAHAVAPVCLRVFASIVLTFDTHVSQATDAPACLAPAPRPRSAPKARRPERRRTSVRQGKRLPACTVWPSTSTARPCPSRPRSRHPIRAVVARPQPR